MEFYELSTSNAVMNSLTLWSSIYEPHLVLYVLQLLEGSIQAPRSSYKYHFELRTPLNEKRPKQCIENGVVYTSHT